MGFYLFRLHASPSCLLWAPSSPGLGHPLEGGAAAARDAKFCSGPWGSGGGGAGQPPVTPRDPPPDSGAGRVPAEDWVA